jgi:hypothetical protein
MMRRIGVIMIGRGNRSTRRKPAPVPLGTPQTPHAARTEPGRRGEKPASNRLSYGTAIFVTLHGNSLSVLAAMFACPHADETCLAENV